MRPELWSLWSATEADLNLSNAALDWLLFLLKEHKAHLTYIVNVALVMTQLRGRIAR